jgi:hypothetical protein
MQYCSKKSFLFLVSRNKLEADKALYELGGSDLLLVQTS